MLHQNKLGITWIATEEETTDVLIGRFKEFDMDEVNATIDSLRKDNPSIGTEIKRGGQFVHIPVRQPNAPSPASALHQWKAPHSRHAHRC